MCSWLACVSSALALQSFVALRLACGGDESLHAWAMESDEAKARWERACELLEAKQRSLAAVENMVHAASGEDDDSGGDAS